MEREKVYCVLEGKSVAYMICRLPVYIHNFCIAIDKQIMIKNGHKFGINWGMECGMKLFDYVINIQQMVQYLQF